MKYGKDPRIYNIMCKEFVGDGSGNLCGVKAAEIKWVKVRYLSFLFSQLLPFIILHAKISILVLGLVSPRDKEKDITIFFHYLGNWRKPCCIRVQILGITMVSEHDFNNVTCVWIF